ncbi:MAG: hypothetical protein KJO07_05160, partial [Deltaproteobacteria bacterium]|nr:hypothetical protein [Deltaproteobacteria bacterium]
MAGVRIAPLVALLTGCFAVGYEDLPSPDGDGGPVSTCSSDDDVGAPYAGGNGQAETPYRICTTDQLIAAITRSEDLGAYFELSDHLDLTGINFDGIGSMDTPFTGVFDGQGFTISGLNIATDMRSGVGFFNAVDGARISNLVFESPEIQADTSSSVGTVIGYCDRSQLVNTTINDMVVRGGSDVGGIAGEQYECKLIGGTVSGTVVGQLDNVGGLVGATGQGDIIGFDATLDVDSPLAYSVGGIVGLDGWSRTLVQDVNVEGTVVGFEDVGGFLGANGDGIYFYRSTFKGEVTGKSGVGGFAGAAYDIPFTIRSSSADVTINGNSEVGGMVGRFYYRSHFYDSYVTGTINGTGANQDRFGGVFGGVEYYGWVERSYVNMTINSEARTVGGVAGGVGYWSANVDAYDIKDCITITDISGSSATDTVSLFVGENTDEPIIATGSVHYAGASCVNNGTGGCGPGGAGVANLADLYNPANAPMNTWDFDGIWVANAGAMPTLDLSRGSEPSVAASCDTQTLAQIDPDALPWVVTYNCDLAIADADKNEEHTVLLGPGHTCSWIYPERAALE